MPRTPDIDAAEQFIWSCARLLDRHRFAFLFRGGSPDAVVRALRPYQNDDGGFGNALEPDGRGAASQPLHGLTALQALAEAGPGASGASEMLELTVAYLAAASSSEDGGVPVAFASVLEAPRAPWWSVDGDRPASSLLCTANLVGVLLGMGVSHPWIDRAARFCWDGIARLKTSHPYELEGCIAFLDAAPDRARAETEAARLGGIVREQRLVLLDPDRPDTVTLPNGYAPGETHGPLEYATRPSSLAQRWFSDDEIERALEASVAAQKDDGGWSFNWRAWNPLTTLEWRGSVTVRALTTLRAYGRLGGA
jgi:hypothetical protein